MWKGKKNREPLRWWLPSTRTLCFLTKICPQLHWTNRCQLTTLLCRKLCARPLKNQTKNPCQNCAQFSKLGNSTPKSAVCWRSTYFSAANRPVIWVCWRLLRCVKRLNDTIRPKITTPNKVISFWPHNRNRPFKVSPDSLKQVLSWAAFSSKTLWVWVRKTNHKPVLIAEMRSCQRKMWEKVEKIGEQIRQHRHLFRELPPTWQIIAWKSEARRQVWFR